MARMILKLFKEKRLREEMGKRGLSLVKKRFSSELIAMRIERSSPT